jgi:hypothetical protein
VLLQYVVETKFVGEQEMGIAGADIVDIKTRVVDVAQPGPTCPVNTGEHLNHVNSCAEQQPCLQMKSSTVAISSAGCLCSVNLLTERSAVCSSTTAWIITAGASVRT